MEKQYCDIKHIRKDPILPLLKTESENQEINENKTKTPGFYCKKVII